MRFRLLEEQNNTAVFTFGRMSPPTVGHEKLIQAVVATAKANKADHYIFLSQTQKAPKDPLGFEDKKRFAKMIFKGVNISDDSSIKTPFQALEKLGQSYKNVIMVVGDDRVNEFKTRMSQYAEQWGIEHFDVVSAGSRDPDAAGVEGMSASKVREFAANGDYEGFASGIPNTVNDKIKKMMFDKVRQGMGIE